MATVTDNTSSANTVTKNTSSASTEDSNVNVLAFGELILADILPTILWLINQIADMTGSQLAALDKSGSSVDNDDKTISNSIAYDDSAYTYDSTLINYDGNPLQGVVVDMSGT